MKKYLVREIDRAAHPFTGVSLAGPLPAPGFGEPWRRFEVEFQLADVVEVKYFDHGPDDGGANQIAGTVEFRGRYPKQGIFTERIADCMAVGIGWRSVREDGWEGASLAHLNGGLVQSLSNWEDMFWPMGRDRMYAAICANNDSTSVRFIIDRLVEGGVPESQITVYVTDFPVTSFGIDRSGCFGEVRGGDVPFGHRRR